MSSKYSNILLLSLLFCLTLTACSNSTEENPLAAEGKKVYATNCLGCHPLNLSKPNVGPDLAGLDSDAILEESIREPGKQVTTGYQNLMPSADQLGLSDADIKALLRYLTSLSKTKVGQ